MAHPRSNSVSRLICGSGWDCSRWSTPDVGVLLVDVAVRVFGHSEERREKRDDRTKRSYKIAIGVPE